jgi:hypothetical protein
MPDETNREKHKVIVLKNQNYDMTCSVSVSAQYAEAVKTYMLLIVECGLKKQKAVKTRMVLLPSAFCFLPSILQNRNQKSKIRDR